MSTSEDEISEDKILNQQYHTAMEKLRALNNEGATQEHMKSSYTIATKFITPDDATLMVSLHMRDLVHIYPVMHNPRQPTDKEKAGLDTLNQARSRYLDQNKSATTSPSFREWHKTDTRPEEAKVDERIKTTSTHTSSPHKKKHP